MIVVIDRMLLFALTALLFIGLIRLALKEQRHQLHGIIPNISRIPVVGGIWHAKSFHPENLHEKFAEYVQRYGNTFMTTILGKILVVTAEPRLVDSLFQSQQNIRKHELYLTLSGWLGNGLLLSHGTHWHAMRKIITPAFHFNILDQFINVFDKQCNVLIQKLLPLANEAKALDIYPFMNLVTLDIISETAMGVNINAQLDTDSPVAQAIKNVTNVVATRFTRPHLMYKWVFRLTWPSGYRRQIDNVRYLHQFTDSIIEKRRHLLQQEQRALQPSQEGSEKKRAALLDTLLQSTLHDAPLTDKEIRDEVSTFIFEGHDTTTSASSFCLYLISRHPQVQQRLFEELRTHFGADLQRPVVYNDFPALKYLHCVVKESLRLYPPIPAVGRWLSKDLIVDNINISAGTNIVVLLWQLLRDKTIYKEPLRFCPERFSDDGVQEDRSVYSYIPFSAGPRNCIGQRFAMFELKTIVIKLLRQFEVLPLGADVKPSIKIVLRSSTGVNLGLRVRSYGAES